MCEVYICVPITDSCRCQDSPSLPPTPPKQKDQELINKRRENHKLVERRRRTAINKGISELAILVPGCEKNKSSVLNRTIQYIHQMNQKETELMEKWSLEKLLLEQAVNQLCTERDHLKKENEYLKQQLARKSLPSSSSSASSS